MQTISELEVYEAGQLTVIGFGGREVLDDLNMAECRDEIAELELVEEERLCQAHGIQFLSFPITDRSVPSSEDDFKELVKGLEKLIQEGKNVAVHCRQGDRDCRRRSRRRAAGVTRACVGPAPPSGGHVRGTRRAPAHAGRRTASHHRRTGRPHARGHRSGGGCASGVRRAIRCR